MVKKKNIIKNNFFLMLSVEPSQQTIQQNFICFLFCFTVCASKQRLSWLKTIHFNIIIFLPLL